MDFIEAKAYVSRKYPAEKVSSALIQFVMGIPEVYWFEDGGYNFPVEDIMDGKWQIVAGNMDDVNNYVSGMLRTIDGSADTKHFYSFYTLMDKTIGIDKDGFLNGIFGLNFLVITDILALGHEFEKNVHRFIAILQQFRSHPFQKTVILGIEKYDSDSEYANAYGDLWFYLKNNIGINKITEV